MKKLIIFTLILINFSLVAQVRMGSCRSANEFDRFYLTPYVGMGTAKFIEPALVYRTNTLMAGLDFHYMFNAIRLGAGIRYQTYTKPGHNFIKPYITAEYPIFFSEFEDFGAYLHFGVDVDMGNTPEMQGPFGETGLFFNYVVNSFSGLYIRAGYAYSSLDYDLFLVKQNLKISEWNIMLGYRIWF
jgi:hypothetical protein